MAFLLSAWNANIASAQRKANKEELFAIKDLDEDEKLSDSEFSGGSVGKMREKQNVEFGRKDLDGDGYLSVEEFKAEIEWTEEEKEQQQREKKKQQLESVRQHQLRQETWLKGQDQDGNLRLSLQEYCLGKEGGDLAVFKGRFVVLDKNQDGQLVLEELLDDKATRTDPRVILPGFDDNQDGKVSFSEYMDRFKDKAAQLSNSIYFYRCDINRSGDLRLREFGNLLYIKERTQLVSGMPAWDAAKTYYDLNEDEKVDFEEFKSLLEREYTKLEYIESLFQKLDKNKNGRLSIEEVGRMKGGFEYNKSLAFLRRDVDMDGQLRLSEQIGPYVDHPEGDKRKDYFLSRDFDQSGWLSLQQFLMKDSNRRVQFLRLDVNKTGELEREVMLANAADEGEEESIERLFRSHDLDRNNSISKDEFLQPPSAAVARFGAADLDQDGKVGLMEFVSDEDLEDPTGKRLREFQARDVNQDGYLGLEEFRLPKEHPRVKYGMMDIDGDGRLSPLEYMGSTKLVLNNSNAKASFRGQDLDRDGFISLEEFQVPAKDPRVRFSTDDVNGDGYVDKMEMLGDDKDDKDRIRFVGRFFRPRDLDHDRRLDPEEYGLKWEDPRVKFNGKDHDENGTLSEEEFLTGVNRRNLKNNLRKVFSKKDQDEDRQLTPEEFALSAGAASFEKKILNLPPKEREFARLDQSEDGLLDPTEFGLQLGEQKFSKVQAKKIFDTLDRDYNATLTLNEYLAKDDPTPQLEFAKLDKNCDRMLGFGEFRPFAKDEKSPRKLFNKYDADQSNGLEPEEFVLFTNGIASRQRWNQMTSFFTASSSLVTAGIVVVDFILVFFIGRFIYRKFFRQKPSVSLVNDEVA